MRISARDKKKKSAVTAAIALLVLLMCVLSACGGMRDSAVIVAGSTSVQPYAELLVEEFALRYPNSRIDVQGGGSSAGITAAESGAAEIGMSSRALKESERDLWSAEIAKDGLAIIISPDNPLGNLTLEQIRNIYTGAVTNWNELGGRDARIHIISREEGSGTRSAFEELVMDKSYITPKAIIQDSNGAVRQLVASDKNSIGFISLGLVDETVKAVKLGGIEPTWETVSDGSYSLYRPFLFISAGEPTGQAKQFIEFTLSQEGQNILINEGLVPPDKEG